MAFRADAAFAKPEIYDALETRTTSGLCRLRHRPANKSDGRVEIEVPDGLSIRRDGRSRKPLVRYKQFSLPGEEMPDHAQT